MFSKYIVPALAASNLLGVVSAANHRHLHKRNYIATEVEIVTDIVTVTVTEGDLPTPAPAPSAQPAVAEAQSYKGEATKAAPSPEPVISMPTQAAVQAPAPVVSKVSSAVASDYPVAPSSGKGGKRGLAYNDPKLVSNICSNSNKFSWAYNWGSQSDGLDAAVTFIPTLWGPQPVHSQGWAENAKKAIAAGADTLMSFNECDNGGQCNMDAGSAAAAHKSFMQPFVGKAKILAPSITSSQDKGAGIDWLNAFKQACGADCPMDGCNAHWYGPGGEAGAEEFLTHLRNVNTACGKNNVWVTEFAATSGDTDKFVSHALNQLDTNATYNFVEKYSYFYLATGSLMQSTNALSTFGNIYATQ
ncbi:alkali-sensitive linkage protein 1 [Apiospora kogelbergensis]|uniref:Alkali-sensitive linkage protein 1 n=1 Tax=Apiospora kogelbergensis TaxID=1337665 RepID=A0AAW0R8K4_9PEZI